MSDPLFDDVKDLLDKEKGDERILKQILRACENNEVISNYERNYVKKLAEKYLGRKSIEEKPSIKKPSIPDVVLSEPTSIPKSQTFQKEPSKTTKSESKNTKMMLGLGGVALVIIIVIAVTSTGISDVTSNTGETKPIIASPSSTSFSIETDSDSYQTKDIISISGKFKNSGVINLSIEKQDGTLVWTEQLKTKSDGRFSTLAIAGGPGWEESGTFTLKAQNDSQTESKKFSFTA